MKYSFESAGAAFAFALKTIYDGNHAKLQKEQGAWSVVVIKQMEGK